MNPMVIAVMGSQGTVGGGGPSYGSDQYTGFNTLSGTVDYTDTALTLGIRFQVQSGIDGRVMGLRINYESTPSNAPTYIGLWNDAGDTLLASSSSPGYTATTGNQDGLFDTPYVTTASTWYRIGYSAGGSTFSFEASYGASYRYGDLASVLTVDGEGVYVATANDAPDTVDTGGCYNCMVIYQ